MKKGRGGREREGGKEGREGAEWNLEFQLHQKKTRKHCFSEHPDRVSTLKLPALHDQPFSLADLTLTDWIWVLHKLHKPKVLQPRMCK